MVIADDDRIKWIRYLQCQLGILADTTSKAFAYRKKNRECLRDDLILMNNVIRILYKYVSFEDEPTYAYTITFERTGSAVDTVTLTIGADAYPLVVSGSYTNEEIAEYYYSTFTSAIQSPDLSAAIDGETLYVWSIDPSLSYSSTTTITSSGSTVTGTATSLQGNLQDILDLWNCLTNEELCGLISLSKDLIEECDC